VSPERFARHLGERVPAHQPAMAALAGIHAGDLYFACACASGQPAAIAAFESRFAPGMVAALRRLRLTPAVVEELMLVLRERLFVGDAPVIANYGGRAHLRRFLRVVTVRAAGRHLGKSDRERPMEDGVLEDLSPVDQDPEILHLKRAYHAEFKAAFTAALQALPDRKRTLLRQRYMDDLNIDDLAALHHVHRATAARWLVAARESLLHATREAMARGMNVTSNELDSIFRLIESQLHVTLRSQFRM
jgi:RNA polymerase sigma-70 factor (ECF subfamily)